jgi:hypothetical protein
LLLRFLSGETPIGVSYLNPKEKHKRLNPKNQGI